MLKQLGQIAKTLAKGLSNESIHLSGALSGGSLSGFLTGKVNASNVLKHGYANNSVVYACTDFITKKGSQADWTLFRSSSGKSLKSAKLEPTNPKSALDKSQNATEIEDHEILRLLKKPNEHQSWRELFIYFVSMKVLTGNAFCLKQRSGDRGSKIVRLIPLSSNLVRPHFSVIGEIYLYTYHGDGFYLEILPEDMIRWSEFPAAHYTWLGVSRYEAAGYSIEKSNNANISGASMMKKGGMVGLITQNNRASGEKSAFGGGLTEPQKEKLENDIHEHGQNPHSYGSTLVTNLDLSWNPIGFKPSEMNFDEIQLESLREICRVNGLQPFIFGDTASSTYNNMREAKKDSIMDGVLPELTSLRDIFNKHLVQDEYFKDERLYLDYDPFNMPELQDDYQKLAEWLAKAWWVKGKDKQRIMNMEPDEESPIMDEYMIPRNLQPASGKMGEENLEDILAELRDGQTNGVAQ